MNERFIRFPDGSVAGIKHESADRIHLMFKAAGTPMSQPPLVLTFKESELAAILQMIGQTMLNAAGGVPVEVNEAAMNQADAWDNLGVSR